MADFIYTQAGADGVFGAFLTNTAAMSLLSSGTRRFVLQNETGATIVFKGTGFDFSGGVPIAGTVTEVAHYDGAGSLLRTVTAIVLPAADVATQNALGGSSQIEKALISADDTVTGSRGNDYLFSTYGNDVIFGGKGRDGIAGGQDDDTMTGGLGGDIFIFGKDFGTDVITDFNAVDGTAGHDAIGVSRSFYRNMTVTQSGADAEISLGHAHLILQNVQISDIGRDDFHFI